MKKIILLLSITLFLGVNTTDAYEYLEQIGNYNGKIIKVEKDSPYKVVSSFSTTGDSLENLVKKVGGVAGVNGSYFCPKDYPSCGGVNKFNGDRISNGRISSRWNNTGVRYIFGYNKNNEPLIHKTVNTSVDHFSGIYNGISNFPLILKEGKSSLSYYDRSGLLDAKMKAKGYKNFICSTKKGDTYMGYIENQTIYDMINVLKNLGCYNALNLDSGWSLSVYSDGLYKRGPGRDIMDSFVVVPDTKRIVKLNNKVKIITKKLKNYLAKRKDTGRYRNILVYKLNKYLSNKNMKYDIKYLLKGVIKNLKSL